MQKDRRRWREFKALQIRLINFMPAVSDFINTAEAVLNEG